MRQLLFLLAFTLISRATVFSSVLPLVLLSVLPLEASWTDTTSNISAYLYERQAFSYAAGTAGKLSFISTDISVDEYTHELSYDFLASFSYQRTSSLIAPVCSSHRNDYTSMIEFFYHGDTLTKSRHYGNGIWDRLIRYSYEGDSVIVQQTYTWPHVQITTITTITTKDTRWVFGHTVQASGSLRDTSWEISLESGFGPFCLPVLMDTHHSILRVIPLGLSSFWVRK